MNHLAERRTSDVERVARSAGRLRAAEQDFIRLHTETPARRTWDAKRSRCVNEEVRRPVLELPPEAVAHPKRFGREVDAVWCN